MHQPPEKYASLDDKLSDIVNATSSGLTDSEKRKGDRLKVLKNFLYGSGISYVVLSITIVVLNVLNFSIMSNELTILVTFIGAAITTIIGVIAGTSID